MKTESGRAATAYLWHLIVDHKAIQEGHFAYTDKWHAQYLIDTLSVFTSPKNVQIVGEELLKLGFDISGVDTVLTADPRGGLLLAYEVAARLNAQVVLAERTANAVALPDYVLGKRVLIVDDGINTGGTAARLLDLAIVKGAEIVGCAAFLNRFPDDLGKAFQGRVRALVDLPAEYQLTSTEHGQCAWCRQYQAVAAMLGVKGSEDDRELLRLKGLLTLRSGYLGSAEAEP